MDNKIDMCRQELTYVEAKDIIQEKLTNIRMDFIAVGYYLKYIRDNEMYREEGYETVWEFAEDNYGIRRTTASRWMTMNDRFSENGNTPVLAEEYKAFGKSQLQEILYLDDEQVGQVNPSMTVKEIRKRKQKQKNPEKCEQETEAEYLSIRKEEKMEQIPGQMCVKDYPEMIPEKPLSILGYPKTVYPEDCLLLPHGCGGKYDCFSCHRDGCGIRQQECWCVDAPCGNPFPCTTLNVVEKLRNEVGSSCQFVNLGLAETRAGDGEPVPCCKRCETPCGYECRRSVRQRYEQAKKEEEIMCDVAHEESLAVRVENIPESESKDVIDAEYEEIPEKCCEDAATDMDVLREVLKKEKFELEEWIKVDKVDPLPPKLLQKKKIVVGALAGMLCDLENNCEEEPEQFEQPELPLFKNNDQRKKWLNNYKAWGLWYRDENIDVNYYKYDFPDESRLIVAEYPEREGYWSDETRDEYYFHFLERNKKKYESGSKNRVYDEKFKNHTDSETYMVEYLKNLQKGEKQRCSQE